MSATELDLPLLPSADQIRRRMFATVRRGFDPDQVRDYLMQVADQVEALEERLREAQLEVESALGRTEPRRDPYEELGARVAELIRTADHEAESIRRQAQADSERLVGEARAEADRVRVDAQARAEEARQEGTRSLEEAQAQADRTLSGLAARRNTLIEQLQSMKEHLLSVAQDLEAGLEDPTRSFHDDVREDSAPQAPQTYAAGRSAGPGTASDESMLDPAYEDLWTLTEQLDMPEILDVDVPSDESEGPPEE